MLVLLFKVIYFAVIFFIINIICEIYKNINKRCTKMAKSFDELLAQVSEIPTKKVAVACAQDDAVLEAVKAAKERGIADAILVGDEAKIRTIASVLKMDIKKFEIINVVIFSFYNVIFII